MSNAQKLNARMYRRQCEYRPLSGNEQTWLAGLQLLQDRHGKNYVRRKLAKIHNLRPHVLQACIAIFS